MLGALDSRERALLERRRLPLCGTDGGQRLSADCVPWPGDGQQCRASPGLKDRPPAPGPSRPADKWLRPLRLSNVRRCAASLGRARWSGEPSSRRTCVALGCRSRAVCRREAPSHATTARARTAGSGRELHRRKLSSGRANVRADVRARCARPGLLDTNRNPSC